MRAFSASIVDPDNQNRADKYAVTTFRDSVWPYPSGHLPPSTLQFAYVREQQQTQGRIHSDGFRNGYCFNSLKH